MQYVKDDMDELFRRAAENYPLDTNNADWNKVLAAMQGQASQDPAPEKKGNKKGRLLWLLLLLPLGLICNQLYTPGDLGDKTISGSQAQKENQDPRQDLKNKIQNNKHPEASTTDLTRSSPKSLDIQKPDADYSSSGSFNDLNRSSSANHFRAKNISPARVANIKILSKGQGEKQSTDYEDFIAGEASGLRKYISEIVFNREMPETPSTAINKALTPITNPVQENSKQNLQLRKPKRFYAGLMGGIDATTVKFQKIENHGYDYGLLFGYSFNKKWSIETGAYVENKYYYSEGKYFNTSKLTMPSNARISEVSGDCKMIEVPLSLRYNFSSNRKSGWFSTLGTSSYFMREENYDYMYYYGSVGPVPHHKVYKNSSKNLFSNISISGGYTHNLGKFADLRVEPYLKVPISGLGIGSLPLFSAGLQIGVTKKF